MKKIINIFLVVLFFSCSPQNENDKYFDKQYINPLLEKVTFWQLNHPKHPLCDWTNGAFYAGVFAAWETTHSEEIYKSLLDLGTKTSWKPFPLNDANTFAICQTFTDIYRIEKKQEIIQPLIDGLTEYMGREYIPPVGVPWQDLAVQDWWWCDALFMAPPAIVKLGVTCNKQEYLQFNDKLFKECYDLLYDKEEHLFARDIMYVIKGDGKDIREKNGEKVFWGRGGGWVLAGLARVLAELPKDYPKRPFYEQLFKEMAAKIESIQQEDGLWRCSLLDPESYPGGEVSGSGFFCYALAWGINNKLLDKKTYLPAVEKAWMGLLGCVNEDGCVGWVQPIGDNPLKNFNKDSWEVFGTGAFLLAGSEVIKLKR
jgi:rhamnogalacturonyl hydrolase YesR